MLLLNIGLICLLSQSFSREYELFIFSGGFLLLLKMDNIILYFSVLGSTQVPYARERI